MNVPHKRTTLYLGDLLDWLWAKAKSVNRSPSYVAREILQRAKDEEERDGTGHPG